MRPTNDFVLLEESKPESYEQYRSYSKIVTPDAYQHGPEDRPVMGRVIAKGDECHKYTIPVGCIALAGKWTGCRFPRHGINYVLIKESDILAVIE